MNIQWRADLDAGSGWCFISCSELRGGYRGYGHPRVKGFNYPAVNLTSISSHRKWIFCSNCLSFSQFLKHGENTKSSCGKGICSMICSADPGSGKKVLTSAIQKYPTYYWQPSDFINHAVAIPLSTKDQAWFRFSRDKWLNLGYSNHYL